MSNITIPAAALEAGARAIAVDGGIADPEWSFYKETARAAFLAMLTAWPGMQHDNYVIVLPLTEASDDPQKA